MKMASLSLSEEQKRRMEENRKRALELRAQREQGKQGTTAQPKQGGTLPVKQLFTKLNPVLTSPRNSSAINKNSLSANLSSHSKTVVTCSGHSGSVNFQSSGHRSDRLPSTSNRMTSVKFNTETITNDSKLQFNNQLKLSSPLGTLKGKTSSSPLKMSQFGGKHSPASTNTSLQVKDQSLTTNPFQNMKCSTSKFYSKKPSQPETIQKVDFSGNNDTTFISASPRGSHFVTFVSKDRPKQQLQQQRPMFVSKASTACRFVLISQDTFAVNTAYDQAVINVFKSMKTKQYDASERRWAFNLSEHRSLVFSLRESVPGIEIHPLPRHVLSTFMNPNVGKKAPEANLTSVDEKLVTALMPFQKEGVDFAIHRNGRALIADEMGLGKTLQAVCVACYYRAEWPLLVVSPSSMKYAWAKAFEQWVPSLDTETIHVIVSSDKKLLDWQVLIISYDLMSRRLEELKKKNFQVCIMDESHFLKNFRTVRTKSALPLLKLAPRRILLSGTPALSRPVELYTQVQIIDAGALPSFHDFGLRYCDAKQSNWGWDYSGASNLNELQLILEERVMVRRLKSDVMSQLPAKIRQVVLLDPRSINTSSRALKASEAEVSKAAFKDKPEKQFILQYFTETASVKLKAVGEYIQDLLEGDQKFLVFAYHQNMLDTIEEACVKKKIRFIRIDGKTPSNERQLMCDKFQTKKKYKVAILSIVAANAGITLTAASLVVFAELFWNPGILVQAEDRAHRIGQRDTVFIRYLIAKGTVDDLIWPLIQKKLKVLKQAGLSKNEFFDVDCSEFRNPKQESILPFLEKTITEEEFTEEELEELAKLTETTTDEDATQQSSATLPENSSEEQTDDSPPRKRVKLPSE